MSESTDESHDDQVASQSQTADQELKDLVVNWLRTATWEESQAFLKTNKERLLSKDALEILDTLLAESARKDDQDEHRSLFLQRHRTLLEQACSESIEAAYAQQERLSSLASTLPPISDELHQAFHALMAVNSSDELIALIEQYPVLLTPEAATAIDTSLVVMQQMGQEDRVQVLEERYITLKQVQMAKRLESDPLIRLLIEWLGADGWIKSEEILRLHADKFLSKEGLEALQELQEVFALHPDERFRETLQEHLAIVQEILGSSIDAVYDKLRPSAELRGAFNAFLSCISLSEILEQLEQHPILLTSEAVTRIERTLATVRRAQPEAAHLFEWRYNVLKQVVRVGLDSYSTAFNILSLINTPAEMHQAISQYPILLDDQVINSFTSLIAETTGNKEALIAQA